MDKDTNYCIISKYLHRKLETSITDLMDAFLRPILCFFFLQMNSY